MSDALCVLLLAGLALPMATAAAQTRSAAPAPSGMHLRLTFDTGVHGVPGPARVGSGVRATLPGPVRPTRGRMHLPVTPPAPPPAAVDPPPFVVVPALRERRRDVVIVHQPVVYHDPYTGLVVPQHVAPPMPLVPPAAVPQVEPEPLTGRELGDAYLHWDEPEQAIIVYQEHLADEPDDHRALRMLGLALIDAGRVREGIAAVALAYRREPGLAQQAIPHDVFGPPADTRRNLNRVSVYANRVDTASAWLTLAALMQAEGRTRPAARMIDRAEQAGLDQEVLDAMRAAVGPSR